MKKYPDHLKDLAEQYRGKRTSNLTRYKPSIYYELVEWTNFLPESSSATQRLYHVDHDLFEIPNCSNEKCNNKVRWFKEYKPQRYADFCSTKCAASDKTTSEKKRKTCQEKYGVNSYSQTDEFKNKIKSIDSETWKKAYERRKQTNVERYGTENAHLTEEAKAKREKTNLERFGHKNILASEYVKNIKREKYGTDAYVKVPEFNEKRRKTMLERYGVEYSGQSEIIEKKKIQTMNEKYGVSSFSQTKEFVDQLKNTYNEKYGVDHHMNRYLSKNTLHLLKNQQWLYEQHYYKKRTISNIANELEIDTSTLCDYFYAYNIPILHFSKSSAEKEISEFLTQHNIFHETSTRSIISPYELDIFIPEHNIAIEYCGLYWHSTATGKSSRYHLNKTEMCKEKGIRLITLFEDEWIHKKDIVKSKLLHILNKDLGIPSVYARSCNVEHVDTVTKKQFFNENHIQGDGPSSINIALMYDNGIVACIGFIKQGGDYVLNRYATSKKVVGGFSKLLKHFQRNYNWNKIITFADLRWSDGNIYEKTGFHLEKILAPDYEYVDLTNMQRLHKFNFRHKNLPNILDNYDPSLSEAENTRNNNWYRIYNCGLKRYTLTKKAH